jgi:hypothetical protein
VNIRPSHDGPAIMRTRTSLAQSHFRAPHDPRPRQQVHHVVRSGPPRERHAGRQDPDPVTQGERRRRAVRRDTAPRMPGPSADLR